MVSLTIEQCEAVNAGVRTLERFGWRFQAVSLLGVFMVPKHLKHTSLVKRVRWDGAIDTFPAEDDKVDLDTVLSTGRHEQDSGVDLRDA